MDTKKTKNLGFAILSQKWKKKSQKNFERDCVSDHTWFWAVMVITAVR